jgi:hypothetical protein
MITVDPRLDPQWPAWPVSARPTLFVVIDTEEEFDWGAPFARDRRSVSHLRHVGAVQRLMRTYGITPIYVIDYPVATDPAGYEPLGELHDAGEATIGAHLHPWVTPPFDEPLDARHSYACNLDPKLEAAKLRITRDAIAERFGAAPKVYKAGRYGFDARTAALVEQLGFDVDTSINPAMDFSADGGPSFEAFDARPFWFGMSRRLLELPCTTALIGAAGRMRRVSRHAMRLAQAAVRVKVPAILSRLRILDRVMLSPEGFALAEMRRLTKALLARGVRTFTLSFHSPSIEPGHTPYVRTRADLSAFLKTLDDYFAFFFGALNGATVPIGGFVSALRAEGLR